MKYLLVTLGLLAAALCCCGPEKSKKEPDAKAVHRALPTEAARKPKVRRAKPGGIQPYTEQFAGQIGSVDGTVHLKSGALDRTHPAKAAEKLFGGGALKTEKRGKTTVALREIGTAVLGETSHLVIAPYTRCGAVLVRGTLHLTGPPTTHKRNACYLHTPGVSVRTPQAGKARIAVSENGKTLIGALVGQISFIDIQGRSRELSSGKQVTVNVDGIAGEIEPLPVKGQFLLEWVKKESLTADDRHMVIDGVLRRAEKVANRLELDVERMVELMGMNRKISQERRRIAKTKPRSEKRLRELTSFLAEQAREMVSLKEKCMLEIHRIVALVEIAKASTPPKSGFIDRAESLNKRLESMKEKLPPLFNRPKMKPLNPLRPNGQAPRG